MCGDDLFVRGVDTDAKCTARLSDIPEIIYFYKDFTRCHNEDFLYFDSEKC